MPDEGAEAVGLLQRLIACDTSNPPGREAQAAAMLEEYLRPLGIECERIAKDPARPNLVARLRGGGGPSLAFLAHLDVVQARREDWSVEPFAGIERDGAVWGRGAIDMKCQVAAVAVALATLARERLRASGDLLLILTADEEVGEAGVGMPFLVETRPGLAPDYVVGEGAGERYRTPGGPIYLLDRGVKCSAGGTLTIHGRPGDASLHGTGVSAVSFLATLLARFERCSPERRVPSEVEPLLDLFGSNGDSIDARVAHVHEANEALGRIVDSLTTNVFVPSTVDARGPSNVVPEQATVGLYGASLPGVDKADLEAELRSRLGDGRYELDVDEPEGGLVSPLGTPLHEAIEAFLAERDPEARLVPALGYGFSDCQLAREAWGSVTYGFVPFRHADPLTNLSSKHGVDEHVRIDDLAFQTDFALYIARRLLASRNRP
jgi:acetylornithine deacetylase/succinyl-diaminopimelate desuccinylase-like protein